VLFIFILIKLFILITLLIVILSLFKSEIINKLGGVILFRNQKSLAAVIWIFILAFFMLLAYQLKLQSWHNAPEYVKNKQWHDMRLWFEEYSAAKGEISLDGRRLGFIYRNILANRAVELAKAEVFAAQNGSFVDSARYVVQSSIPIGLTDDSPKREESIHKIEICFDLLSSYFDKSSEIHKVNLIYELFTTKDVMRKTEILINENLGEFVCSKAWNDLINSGQDITLLAYTALQVEARKPGTIPQELLESLSQKVSGEKLSSNCISKLQADSIEYLDEIENLLKRESNLEQIIAYSQVEKLVEYDFVTMEDIEDTKTAIKKDVTTFENLIRNGGE